MDHCKFFRGPTADPYVAYGIMTSLLALSLKRFQAKHKSRLNYIWGIQDLSVFMHSRLPHASKPNLSDKSRTLFLCVFSSDDTIPCSPNPMPNKYERLMVRGTRKNTVRTISYEMELRELPSTTSFFDQKAKHPID